MIGRGPAKERDGILDGAEREQVAELLEAGNHLHRFAAFIGDVVAEQLRNFAPRRKKVTIVDQRVFHTGFGERRRQLRFPHALREPGAGGTLSKMFFDKLAQPPNLLDSILVRNRDQDWFVESSSDYLHLAARHKRANAL